MQARAPLADLRLVAYHDYRAPRRPELAGGDVLAVTPCIDGSITILVGDVSPKGREGEEFARWLAAVFGIVSRCKSRPSSILACLNAHMCNAFGDPARGLFATAFICQWHPTQQRCLYAGAGAEVPILFDRLGRPRPLDVSGGLVLGIERNAAYSDAALHVDRDDTLIAYTDGIINARQKKLQGRLGERGLASAVSSCINKTQMPTAPGVLSEVDQLVENYDDDASLVVIRFSESR